jgi:hypothetical protein
MFHLIVVAQRFSAAITAALRMGFGKGTALAVPLRP